MAKLDFKAKTIDDPIIRAGLCAVATLSKAPASRDKYFVVGGVATQSYLPSSCRRGTCDIDLAVLEPLNYEAFKKFSRIAFEFLADHGYHVDTRKGQRSYSLDYSRGEEASFIEFARRDEQNFRSLEKRLINERNHARKKIIEGTTSTCTFACPEDIIVPKWARSVNSLHRNPGFEEFVARMNNLSEEEIKKNLVFIEDLRTQAIRNVGDARDAELLRFISDLYDIRVLSEIGGVNRDYLMESAEKWDSLRDKNRIQERSYIARAVLPEELNE